MSNTNLNTVSYSKQIRRSISYMQIENIKLFQCFKQCESPLLCLDKNECNQCKSKVRRLLILSQRFIMSRGRHHHFPSNSKGLLCSTFFYDQLLLNYRVITKRVLISRGSCLKAERSLLPTRCARLDRDKQSGSKHGSRNTTLWRGRPGGTHQICSRTDSESDYILTSRKRVVLHYILDEYGTLLQLLDSI